MDLTNDTQVMSALAQGPLKEGVKDLFDEITDDIYNIVKSEIYAGGGSEYYDRTGQVLNSVMDDPLVNAGLGYVEAETGMEDNITGYIGGQGMFNHHMSFDKTSVADMIIPWFEGDIGNSSPYFHGAVHMLRRAYTKGQSRIKPCLAKAFAAAGMKLTG